MPLTGRLGAVTSQHVFANRETWVPMRQYTQQLTSRRSAQHPAMRPACAATDTTAQAAPDSAAETSASPSSSGYDPKYRPFMAGMAAGWSFDASEEGDGYWMEVVEGALPVDLQGTYFRNGPGKFQAGGERYGHPYDGDGFVASVSIRGGRAYFRSKFVQTQELAAEELQQTVLFRGAFATQRSGGILSNAMDIYVKNTSNTNVICHGDRCLTLFEASQPYRLDPHTLSTFPAMDSLGGLATPGIPFDLGSSAVNAAASSSLQMMGTGRGLPPELSNFGGQAVTAHPRKCAATGRLAMLGYQVSPTLKGLQTRFTFWEFDEEFNLVAQKEYDLSGYAFVHDFAITENYYIIFQNPVKVDNLKYLAGVAPAASCVEWVEGKPTFVHVVPRPDAATASSSSSGGSSSRNGSSTSGNGSVQEEGQQVEDGKQQQQEERHAVVFEAPASFVFHHANAFEEEVEVAGQQQHGAGDGRRVHMTRTVIHCDSIHYQELPEIWPEGKAASQAGQTLDIAFEAELKRCSLDLSAGVLSVSPPAYNRYLEMVGINEQLAGRRHRYVYGHTSVFSEQPEIGLAKVDMDSGKAEVYLRGHRNFISEPKFIPRTRPTTTTTTTTSSSSTKDGGGEGGSRGEERQVDEDAGWLLASCFNAEAMTSELVLLDAKDLGAGPVAVMRLRRPMPHTVHGCWVPTYYGPRDGE